jgi:hypothetical protein
MEKKKITNYIHLIDNDHFTEYEYGFDFIGIANINAKIHDIIYIKLNGESVKGHTVQERINIPEHEISKMVPM